MRGREIAEKLGVTYQRVHQLTIRLHAQGRVTFGDPDNPLWIVMRTGDKTPFLSRDAQGQLAMKKASKASQRLPVEMVIACPILMWRTFTKQPTLYCARVTAQGSEGWRAAAGASPRNGVAEVGATGVPAAQTGTFSGRQLERQQQELSHNLKCGSQPCQRPG
jgi:hypothetical protein